MSSIFCCQELFVFKTIISFCIIFAANVFPVVIFNFMMLFKILFFVLKKSNPLKNWKNSVPPNCLHLDYHVLILVTHSSSLSMTRMKSYLLWAGFVDCFVITQKRWAPRCVNNWAKMYLLTYSHHLTETSSFPLIVSHYYLSALFLFPPPSPSPQTLAQQNVKWRCLCSSDSVGTDGSHPPGVNKQSVVVKNSESRHHKP